MLKTPPRVTQKSCFAPLCKSFRHMSTSTEFELSQLKCCKDLCLSGNPLSVHWAVAACTAIINVNVGLNGAALLIELASTTDSDSDFFNI